MTNDIRVTTDNIYLMTNDINGTVSRISQMMSNIHKMTSEQRQMTEDIKGWNQVFRMNNTFDIIEMSIRLFTQINNIGIAYPLTFAFKQRMVLIRSNSL